MLILACPFNVNQADPTGSRVMVDVSKFTERGNKFAMFPGHFQYRLPTRKRNFLSINISYHNDTLSLCYRGINTVATHTPVRFLICLLY